MTALLGFWRFFLRPPPGSVPYPRSSGRILRIFRRHAPAVLTWETMESWPLSLNLLRLYPKRLGSAAAGWAASRPLPVALRAPLLGRFVRAYGLDMGEAERPLEAYPSLQALFTRRLKPGIRPQEAPAPGCVNSPVDGQAGRPAAASRPARPSRPRACPTASANCSSTTPQAAPLRGRSLPDPLPFAPRTTTASMCPWPGRVSAVGRVEGELWPVNEASTTHVPRLYERNRRATWVAAGTGPGRRPGSGRGAGGGHPCGRAC